MKDTGHLSASERTMEELRNKNNLYSTIILLLLERTETRELSITGAELSGTEGKILLSFDYNRDTLTLAVAPEETKRLIS